MSKNEFRVLNYLIGQALLFPDIHRRLLDHSTRPHVLKQYNLSIAVQKRLLELDALSLDDFARGIYDRGDMTAN